MRALVVLLLLATAVVASINSTEESTTPIKTTRVYRTIFGDLPIGGEAQAAPKDTTNENSLHLFWVFFLLTFIIAFIIFLLKVSLIIQEDRRIQMAEESLPMLVLKGGR